MSNERKGADSTFVLSSMLPASSPPVMGSRGRAYDEWSLVSQQQLHDDVSSQASGDEKGIGISSER